MNYREKFHKRHEMQGLNHKEAFRNQSKVIANNTLENSFDKVDVIVNFSKVYPCIVRDIDTFEIRKFIFAPDVVIHLGDYIEHDNFTYLTLKKNTNDIFPFAESNLCNYDFPVKVSEIETGEILYRLPNNEPVFKTKKTTHLIPCVASSKIYSQVDNQIFSSPDGAITIYMPYRPEEPSPELDQEVIIHDAQYYVADIIKTNIIKFNGIEKGYLELRLQRMQKNVESQS